MNDSRTAAHWDQGLGAVVPGICTGCRDPWGFFSEKFAGSKSKNALFPSLFLVRRGHRGETPGQVILHRGARAWLLFFIEKGLAQKNSAESLHLCGTSTCDLVITGQRSFPPLLQVSRVPFVSAKQRHRYQYVLYRGYCTGTDSVIRL